MFHRAILDTSTRFEKGELMKKMIALAIALYGAAVAFPADAPVQARPHYGGCGDAYYVNSRGNCVHRPVAAPSAPSGATARCYDGTYSFSQSRRGTCSHHGGVASWLG